MADRVQYRQGDVLLEKIPASEIPKRLKDVSDNGQVILAYGEATGHSHVIEGDATIHAKSSTEEMTRYLKVFKKSQLVHQEHETIDIPKGNYIVKRQREYQPAEAPRRVYD